MSDKIDTFHKDDDYIPDESENDPEAWDAVAETGIDPVTEFNERDDCDCDEEVDWDDYNEQMDAVWLNSFADQIYDDNVKKGFWENKTCSNEEKAMKIALMHSELSEALEAMRKDLMDSHLPNYKGEGVEMGDAIIRILDYCAAYNIPIGEIIIDKLKYNRSRPYKHGKKF